MDIENIEPQPLTEIPPFSTFQPTEKKAKTSLRLKYEAEITVLKKDLGGLEDIRIRLGISRRKICQILMVDPSAWTRWTTPKNDAPPHIYQALKWYLDSKTHQTKRFDNYWEELKLENRNLQAQMEGLTRQIQKIKRWSSVAVTAALIFALASLGVLIAFKFH